MSRKAQKLSPEIPVPPPAAAPDKMAYPEHWTRGQLLDLKRFTDGSYRATLLNEEYDPVKGNAAHFSSGWDAQNFTSWWYQRAPSRWG